LSVPVQVTAWRTVSEMTCNVSSGTLNLTHSLTHFLSPDEQHQKHNFSTNTIKREITNLSVQTIDDERKYKIK